MRAGLLTTSTSGKVTMSPSFSPQSPLSLTYLTWPILLTYLFAEGT